ncbi:MAG: hypothetical protein IJS01_14690, partial [Lentisphaeria bacterium]|nr:hypothetical protein [Lentisphaeria bacterium]
MPQISIAGILSDRCIFAEGCFDSHILIRHVGDVRCDRNDLGHGNFHIQLQHSIFNGQIGQITDRCVIYAQSVIVSSTSGDGNFDLIEKTSIGNLFSRGEKHIRADTGIGYIDTDRGDIENIFVDSGKSMFLGRGVEYETEIGSRMKHSLNRTGAVDGYGAGLKTIDGTAKSGSLGDGHSVAAFVDMYIALHLGVVCDGQLIVAAAEVHIAEKLRVAGYGHLIVAFIEVRNTGNRGIFRNGQAVV